MALCSWLLGCISHSALVLQLQTILLPWWRLKHSVEMSTRFSDLKVYQNSLPFMQEPIQLRSNYFEAIPFRNSIENVGMGLTLNWKGWQVSVIIVVKCNSNITQNCFSPSYIQLKVISVVWIDDQIQTNFQVLSEKNQEFCTISITDRQKIPYNNYASTF